jgi:hypothetical protein
LLGHTDAEVAKRCDAIATAIHQRLTVADLLDLDLTYTPPLSAPWDPIQQVAQTWEAQRLTTSTPEGRTPRELTPLEQRS